MKCQLARSDLHLCVVIIHFIDSEWKLSNELEGLNPGEFVEPPDNVNDEKAMQPVDDTSAMDWEVASLESCGTAQARSLSSAVDFLETYVRTATGFRSISRTCRPQAWHLAAGHVRWRANRAWKTYSPSSERRARAPRKSVVITEAIETAINEDQRKLPSQ